MCKVKHSDKAMKLGSLFLMASVCGVLLFQSSNLHANSGWHEEAYPTTVSYELMTEAERVEGGLVAAVDSGKLSAAKSWTYTLEQGGDYQLGTSWIELLSDGEVDVSITINGKQVKGLRASKDSSKPTGRLSEDFGLFRLESRFEAVAPGSQIEFKAVPSGNVDYRIAFDLVSTVPDFTGLQVLHVADFGAKGDGETDDMSAIHAAVAAAKDARGAIIRFEKDKHYRLIGKKDLSYEVAFELFDTANIKIEGQGATVILHPPDGLANIRRSRNIQIDGLFVDYAPLPYYQGAVTDINIDKMTVDLVVPERYPVPETGICENENPYFARAFMPDAPGARSGTSQSIYVESVSALETPRHVRLHIRGSTKGSEFTRSIKPRLIAVKKGGQASLLFPIETMVTVKDGPTFLKVLGSPCPISTIM